MLRYKSHLEWRDDEEYRIFEKDGNIYTKAEFIDNLLYWEKETIRNATKMWYESEIFYFRKHKLCPCKFRTGDAQIQCDKCNRWYHLKCIGMKSHNIPEDEFICEKCNFLKNKAKRSSKLPHNKKYKSKRIAKKSKQPRTARESRKRLRQVRPI